MPWIVDGALCAAAAGAATAVALRAGRRVRQAAQREAREIETRAVERVTELLAAARRSSRDVLVALAAELRDVNGADAMLAFVPEGDELVCIFAGGARAEHFERSRVRRDAGCVPALAAASGCRATVPEGAPILPADRNAIAVPMLDDRRPVAIAYVSWSGLERRPDFDAAVAAIERAAIPYAIAREREADRADAAYDGLTGLLGPRAFRRLLHDEIERCAARRSRALCLWFVDTDGFKRVNDELGHRAGDAVLVSLGELLREHAGGAADVTARNGGDEFCALLRTSGKSRAIARAQAFCDAVRAYEFGLPLRVTASVGVAAYPVDAATAGGLLEAADAAMYYSKRNGRDRVSFVTENGFASVAAEAAFGVSRNSERCRCPAGEPSAERSAR